MRLFFLHPGARREIVLVLGGLALLFSVGLNAQEPRLTPVVFVPGILGSELEDENGVEVWGAVISSLRRFSRLEFPLDPTQDRITASGLVKELQILGPIQIDQYSGILESFKSMGFQEGENLFLFPYDWRQSNFDSARDLDRFVRSKPALAGKFRIVAHSMGGLVARIYVARHDPSHRVEKLVTLGTPHLGSLSALRPLIEGLGTIENLLAGGEAVVRRVAFSLPALYEMLPFYPNCCLSVPAQGVATSLQLLDPATWLRFRWLPAGQQTPARTNFRNEALRRARELREIYRAGIPAETAFFPIAGSLMSTPETARFSAAGDFLGWKQGTGDGTVFVHSADAQLPNQVRVAIRKHATIFEDMHVKVQLANLLTAVTAPEPFSDTSLTDEKVIQRTGILAPLARVLVVPAKTIAVVGEVNSFEIDLFGPDGELVRNVEVVAYLLRPGSPLRPQMAVDESDAGKYAVQVLAERPGTYRLVVTLPGVEGVFDEFFVATAEALQ